MTADLRPYPDYRDSGLPWLGQQLRAFDDISDRVKREIDLIREYRTRLVADVVTGKLDVREHAPDPGEEIAEPDALAEAFDGDEMAVEQEAGLLGEAEE